MDVPWEEIHKKTECIWACCEECGFEHFIMKSNRDKPCMYCNATNMKQYFVTVRFNCTKCGEMLYAIQGKLQCQKCKSNNIDAIVKREITRMVYGRL